MKYFEKLINKKIDETVLASEKSMDKMSALADELGNQTEALVDELKKCHKFIAEIGAMVDNDLVEHDEVAIALKKYYGISLWE